MKKIFNYDKIVSIEIMDSYKTIQYEYFKEYKCSWLWRLFGDKSYPGGWYLNYPGEQELLTEQQVIEGMEEKYGENCVFIKNNELWTYPSILINFEDGSKAREFFSFIEGRDNRVEELTHKYFNKKAK